MILRNVPAFCLQYDAPTNLIRLEWLAGADIGGLRASADQLLALMKGLAVRHLLLDMNSIPDLSFPDQVWLGDYWMPSLVELALERLVLVTDGNRIHNQLAIDVLHDQVQHAIRFDAQYFSDSTSAMHWLTDGSSRLSALEAEWSNRNQKKVSSLAKQWL